MSCLGGYAWAQYYDVRNSMAFIEAIYLINHDFDN